LFKGRHFDRSVIVVCVRWYLAFNLSLRNLEEMMAERGISVDHATVHRWTHMGMVRSRQSVSDGHDDNLHGQCGSKV
jgi:transposase-like protein